MLWSYNNIIKNSRIKYVSFDVFDTIVGRYAPSPSYVFELMRRYAESEKISLPSNFQKLRRNAETIASKKNVFFNIYDIYESLECDIDDETKVKLIEMELYVECELCFPISERVLEMEKMAKNGKRIILISDMYWPKTLLVKILNKCNIRCFDKIFVSCDEKASKSKGDLYKKVISTLSVSNNEIIHIGDNLKSDYLRALMNGIRTVHVKKVENGSKDLSIDYQVLERFIHQKIDCSNSEYWKYGYSVMGPLLWKYTSWIEEMCNKEKIEKVFFLSRDGYIMQKAYQLMGFSRPSEYMYASRRALITPIIWMTPDLEDVVNLFFTSRDESVKGLLGKVGLSYLDYEKQLDLFDLKPDDRVQIENIGSSKFGQFYNYIREDVIANSKEQFELLKRYLSEISFRGNVAIVDIGWFGDMQRALKRVLIKIEENVNLIGLYLGVVPNSKAVTSEDLSVHGMLFETGRSGMYESEQSFNTLVEWMFGAAHGTVLRYSRGSDNVEPNLDMYEYDNEKESCVDERKVLYDFQIGALEFVKDISQNTVLRYLTVSVDDAASGLLKLGISPTIKEATLFGDIRFVASDANYRYIAKPRKMRKYLRNINLLKRDIRLCGWRVGFLRRLFKINLPYGKLYLGFRKMITK